MDSEGGLGGTSENLFGPLAVALIGFQPQEVDTFRYFMNDMEADMVKVSSKLPLFWLLKLCRSYFHHIHTCDNQSYNPKAG